jgi:type III secretion system YscD/HrpQ family protein
MVIDNEAPQETIYSPMATSHEPPEPEEALETPLPVEEKKDWRKVPIPTKHLVMAGSIAAIFLIMFVSFFSLFKSKGVEIVQKEPASEIKEALDRFSDVQFSYNPATGKLFLAGHVLTGVDYQEMRYRIEQIPFILSVEDNVVIDEGVWKMMNDVISETPAWKGVSVHAPQAGKFVATGYLMTSAEGTLLNEYFTVNFPYLDRLDNQVIIQEVLDAEISAMIGAEAIGAINYQLANGQLVLTGKYNEKKGRQYQTLLKELNRVKGIISVRDFAIGVSPNQASIDVSKDFQVSGLSFYDGRGYSVVLDGKIFTVGDLVVDGLKITSIEPDMILLEKDGLKYKIDYRR